MNLDNKLFFDKDISISQISNKKIGIIGYGNQGRAQALNLSDSKMNVVVGVRENSARISQLKKDKIPYLKIDELIKESDIVALMIPDNQIDAFIAGNISKLKKNQTLLVSHGYSIVYGKAEIPEYLNIVMVAPSGGGSIVRSEYKKGFGVPALVAVHQDFSGSSLDIALAYAKSIGSSRAAVFKSTFKEETETDLFGEQVILTGSIPLIIIESYKVLLEDGYDPVVAWFVCFYELKTIVNLMFDRGLESFYDMVSSTARYGGISRGKKLIDDNFKSKIKEILKDIKNGNFKTELEKSLSIGDDGKRHLKAIFNSEEFSEVENKILNKVKKKVN